MEVDFVSFVSLLRLRCLAILAQQSLNSRHTRTHTHTHKTIEKFIFTQPRHIEPCGALHRKPSRN